MSTPARSQLFSRRRALALAAAAGGLALTGATGVDMALGGPLRRRIGHHTSTIFTPATDASPPVPAPAAMTVVLDTPQANPGDIFYTDLGSPAWLVRTDRHGAVTWSARGAAAYTDFRVQNYDSHQVLTWWESPSTGLAAYAEGRSVVTGLNHSVISTVEKSGRVAPDEHEFLLTNRGTALLTSYVKVALDLRPYGGVKDGLIMNGIAEEIDLVTGAVVTHWESLDHVSPAESHAGVPADPTEPWDYFHINSIKPTPDGNLLISGRHTWGVYKVDRDTGKVLWRLGGKRSDFDLPSSARFGWQHDVVIQRPGLLRMFDNGSDGNVVVNRESAVLWLDLDERRRRASLQAKFTHPAHVSSAAMGNAQLQRNGHVFVCWGTGKRLSEFDPAGRLVFDATLANFSYRGYRTRVG